MRHWSLFRVSDFDIRILESMISKKEVQHIAKLARLGLTEKEIEKHQKEFLKILDYMEKLKEIDVCRTLCRTQGATSLSHPGCDRPMRKDKVSKFNKKLIDGHLRVKQIFRI